MTEASDAAQADRTLKARHRAMWAMGDYQSVAHHVIPELGAVLVKECGVQRGDQVLDIAAGSGNAAIPAALAGADVVASDLTPDLLEIGRHLATVRGAALEWREADAEHLPFADGEFDVVMSCVGIMFAPHHRPAAEEMLRVCRSGGTVGLINWTPQGFVGRMFATMKPFAPRRRPVPSRPRCGGTRSTCTSCWVTRSPTWSRGAGRSAWTGSPGLRTSASSSRPATGPPWPSTAPSPAIRTGSPSWTRRSTPWPPSTPWTVSWSGSTCC